MERGWQITVVTAAPLPTGYTRFYLQRRDLQDPSPVSAEQLIKPVGTTYTFTVETTESRPNLITYDLTAVQPRPNPRLGQKSELGNVVVTTKFLPDPAIQPAGHLRRGHRPRQLRLALKTAGDATSAIENFGDRSAGTVDLRIHPTDRERDAARAGFYDTVQVGDTFDYRTKWLSCGYRFKVTRVAAAAISRTFGIEYTTGYVGRCSTTVDDPTAARDVHFVWKPAPGVPGPGGVRELLLRGARAAGDLPHRPWRAVGHRRARWHAGDS